MKKFIRGIHGNYIRKSSIVNVSVDICNADKSYRVRVSLPDCVYTLAKFDSREEAQKWLDNFMRELEDDSPVNSDIRNRLLHLSDVLGDIYQKLIGVADDDVISDFDTVLDELDDIIDDIKED